jgi:hypothetical protein
LATRSERDIEPVLIWVGRGGHGDVGDGAVLGFARAMRHDRGVAAFSAISMAASVSVSVPIWLTLIRIALAMPLACPRQDLRVGDEQVVADQLHALAELVGQLRPAVPVALGHAVLDRDDRVARRPGLEVVGETGGVKLRPSPRGVLAVLEELRARDVEAEVDVLAQLVAGLVSIASQDHLERRLVRRQVRARSRPRRPPRGQPRSCSIFFSVWKISAP